MTGQNRIRHERIVTEQNRISSMVVIQVRYKHYGGVKLGGGGDFRFMILDFVLISRFLT
jgi:hypothetical protein